MIRIFLLLVAVNATAAPMYDATIERVIDGDTVVASIEIWPGLFQQNQSVRIIGIDTPELRGSAECEKVLARAARDRVVEFVSGDVKIEIKGLDKYGRALGDVFNNGESLSETLIAEGHGRAYDGGTRDRNWCSEIEP